MTEKQLIVLETLRCIDEPTGLRYWTVADHLVDGSPWHHLSMRRRERAIVSVLTTLKQRGYVDAPSYYCTTGPRNEHCRWRINRHGLGVLGE